MRYEKSWRFLFVFMAMACFLQQTSGQSVYIPEELKPWREWVLQKHPEIVCPLVRIDSLQRICVWPARLTLWVEHATARFTLQVRAYSHSLVNLPGDTLSWPYAVTINGRSVPVISSDGMPSVELPPGNYSITGKFKWENRPNFLQVPQGCGIIDLTVNGKSVANPALDHNAILWFNRNEGTTAVDTLSRDNIDVKIYRKLIDGVPIRIISRLKLKVSGQDREMVLGRFLPDSSEVITLACDLPARIEPDGNLRIQLRAGTWEIELQSRRLNHNQFFMGKAQTAQWPKQELWAFEANPQERAVTISGVASIDPSQTGMPQEWQQLPVYLLEQGTVLTINEEFRGDCVPEPNTLTLTRSLWLDFDGSGYTIKDQVRGSVTRPCRMGAVPLCTLGSIQLNSVPQLVTTIDGATPGIEVQQGQMDLQALGRMVARTTIPAVGWKQVFSNVQTTLHLPPGWSVLHVSGSDQVTGSWVSKWTLWDFFLLLVMVVSIARMFNLRWAIVALATFIITFHVEGAPLFIWLACIALAALNRAVSRGRIYQTAAVALILILVAAGGITIGFSVGQLRQALFPQLEHQNAAGMESESQFLSKVEQYEKSVPLSRESRGSARMDYYAKVQTQNYAQYDAAAKIQTGPGVPDWRWNNVEISWTGPVEPDQTITIVRAGPVLNRLVSVVRVIGVCLLLGLFIVTFYRRLRQFPIIGSRSKKLVSAAVLAIFACFGMPGKTYAAFPDKGILDELESRLVKSAEIQSDFIAIESGTLSMSGDLLTIRLTVNAVRLSAFALPGAGGSWRASRITVDGRDASALWMSADGVQYCAVDPGMHLITISGPMEGGHVEIAFPGQVHNFSVETPHLQVFGLANGRIPGGALRIERSMPAARISQETKLLPEPAPVFVEVSRSVSLDKEWSVETKVRRISPENGPIRLTVPLLPGESVISSGSRDSAGTITVYLTRDQNEVSWQSVLPQRDRIALFSARQHLWVEVWALESTPRWHVETDGIATIKKSLDDAAMARIWWPRPGDSVIIKVSVPKPVAGRTLTIRRVSFVDTWGSKASDAVLELSVLSSQADHLVVDLPPKSVLGSVTIDGQVQIAAIDKGKVSIPVHPGEQAVTITWKGREGAAIVRTTPKVSLGRECANLSVKSHLPSDRWLLFVQGPLMGPALLFWPICIVLLAISLALGRIRVLPLKWYHWFVVAFGMSTIDNVGGILLIPWFLVLAYRRKSTTGNKGFNWLQVLIVLLTIGALGSLIATIPLGLLSSPDMQVAGNGSSSYFLNWYSDLSSGRIPQALCVSLPLWVYRIFMLAWSLWVALCVTRWIRWGWQSFTMNGLWKQKDDMPKQSGESLPA